MNIFRVHIVIGFVFLLTVINNGCSTTEQFKEFSDTEKFGEYLEKGHWCNCNNMTFNDLQFFDFCVIGKNHPLKITPLSDKKFTATGVIEIKTLIFGDPEIEEIAYSITRPVPVGIVTDYDILDGWNIKSTETRDVMVFGRGEKDKLIPLWAFELGINSNNCTKLAGEMVKIIYKFQKFGLNKEDLQRARLTLIAGAIKIDKSGDALFNSTGSYQRFFEYLFRLTIDNEGIEGAISFLASIPAEEMKAIKPAIYKWAGHFMVCYYQSKHFDRKQKEQLSQISPKHAKLVELAGNLTRSQQQGLREVIEKNTQWTDIINTPFIKIRDTVESIITEEIYRVDTDLRNGIKERVKELAKQYAEDKDYQKWEKQVLPKIFPDAVTDNNKKE